MRARWALLVCGLWGCATKGSGRDPDPDAVPIHVKDVPGSKTGNESSPGCDGITERGVCKDGRAMSCDLVMDRVNTVDCVAIGRTCVSDVERGASCEMLQVPMGGGGADGGTSGEETCTSGVTLAGFCAGNTAVWCATATGETVTWDCAHDGLTCKMDDCVYGAYCCGSSGGADGGMMASECDRLGLAGECANGKARWCSAGVIQEVDCAAQGKTCQVDTCAYGAFCCGGAMVSPCETLGLRGECGGTGGNTARWCDGSTLHEDDCAAESGVCMIDVCGTGAYCCSCDTLGEPGRCSGNTAYWCEGGTIQHEDCAPAGQTCQENTCGTGAYCCN